MTSEPALAARFDAALGEGPDPRPLAPALRAGHRRVLGRRAAAAVATAVVVIAGAAAFAPGSGDQATDAPPAGPPFSAPPTSEAPTAEPTEDPSPEEQIRFDGQLAVATTDGELVVNPRATIQRKLTVRHGGEVGYAVVGTLRGETTTLFTTQSRSGGMSILDATVTGSLRAWALATLREYVRANRQPAQPPSGSEEEPPPPAPEGLATFTDGTLVPAAGVTVTDEVGGVRLRDFAAPGEPTVAARVTRGEAVYFLVARPDDVIAVEPPPGVETLAQWVDFARAAYRSGAGLR